MSLDNSLFEVLRLSPYNTINGFSLLYITHPTSHIRGTRLSSENSRIAAQDKLHQELVT